MWGFLLRSLVTVRRRRQAPSRSAWRALVAGLVCAWLAYVTHSWAAFSDDWIAMLAFWQGGFELWPGAIAAGLVLMLTLPDNRKLARALAALAVCTFGLSAMQALIRQQIGRAHV